MKEPQLSGIAKALAQQGRHGDDTLVHVSRKELETLQKYGDELGIHLTVNPQTGLPEAFNWGGTLGSVGLPLLVLAATAATGGVAAPWMLAAAGAAGGFGGTLAGGGSTDEALLSGVMGGIGGYGMGSLAGNVAQAGVEQASTEALAQAGTQAAVEQGGTQALSSSAPGIFSQGLQQGATDTVAQTAASNAPGIFGQGLNEASGQTALQQLTQGASQNSGILNTLAQKSGENLVAEGATKGVGSVVNGAFVPNATPSVTAPLQSTPMTGLQQLSKGWDAISGSPSALGNFAMNNASNIGMTGIGAIGAGSTMNPQEQTIVTESDTSSPYKGEMYVDPATGQMRSRAVRRARGGEIWGDYDGVEEAADGGYMPGGGLNYASGGGIGDLGGYSDGGSLLRGPGDGVSDSIPASIEGKRPARLADGEFVIPARAVSELGNGSTEAGSKQLYKMLDRIAAKRKSGKGLAYQANPKKILPA